MHYVHLRHTITINPELRTFSLMPSCTPDEDTAHSAQATEGHRVVRPARGHGRGRGRSARAGAILSP